MSKDRGGRRSSILKPPKVRHPLTELDLKPLDIDDDGVTTDTTRSRRVSFSAKKGVALFTSDHGNTIWHNIYEEANKPDLSDSGGASHFQMSMNSTEGICEFNAVNPGHDSPAAKVEDDSFDESFNTNHDRTFAALPDDSDDEEDHCVDIHAMLTGFSKPAEKELPNIVFQNTQTTFSDHTDALINYKIPLDPLYVVQDDKCNIPGISTLGAKLDVTNIAELDFNGSQMDMSITQGIPLPIQEIKNVTLKSNYYDVSYSERKDSKENWIYDKENIKVHMECHQDTNIQEDVFINYGNEKPHVKVTTSIFDQFQRDFVLKEEHLLEDYPITMKRSLPEGSSLDDSYILPDKMTKNSSDQRCTIIFNQDSSNCDMSMTRVNENLIQCRQELDSFSPEVGKVDENVKLQKSIHYNPNNSDCDMSCEMTKNLQDDRSMDKRRTIIFNQDSSNCDMSMTRVNENLLHCTQGFDGQKENKSTVFVHNKPENNMSMTCAGLENLANKKSYLHNNKTDIITSNITEDVKINIDYNRVLVKNEDDDVHERNRTHSEDIKMESNISIIDDFILQKKHFKNASNTTTSTHCKFAKLDSKEVDSSIKLPPNVETIAKDYEIKCEEKASEFKPFLNIQMSPNKDKTTDGNEFIIPTVDKRRTIIFDHLSSQFDMSITGIVPLNRDIDSQTNDMNDRKFENNDNHLQKNMENIRESNVSDGEMPECKTKSANVVQNSDLNQIKSIGFDSTLPECNVLQTGAITKTLQIQNKTLDFNGISECKMSMPDVIANNEENKRKTIICDSFVPECNVSMTSITTNIIDFDPKISGTLTINEIPNMNNKRKSKHFDRKMSEFTNLISSNGENKRKTINVDPDTSECNMSMTSVIPANNQNKKQTFIFDSEKTECNMSMTNVIPRDHENKRKTIIFEPGMPECNMSITSVIPANNENKRQTFIFDSEKTECNMSMTNVISRDHENKRKTIIFEPGMPECNMSMTSVIPANNENKRRTLIFDSEKTECNMSMTSVIPADNENKRQTSIFDSEKTECNMSMTSVIPSSQENKRKTIIFDSDLPECNMSMTSVIPNNNEINRRTLTVDSEMLECNMSMTSIIPSSQKNKRMTLIFDTEMPECNMSMTHVIPSHHENKRKTIIFDPGMPECNMSMTSVIPANNENKRETFIFDTEKTECNMSTTSVIPRDHENKRKTIIFDPGMPECNMSMTSVIPANNENKRQASIFDSEKTECNISMTSVIPSSQENKRKTIIFDSDLPECNMSMTSVIPNNNEINRRTLTVDSEMPECNMSMTGVIPVDNENKRRTIIFDSEMPECNMTMTGAIPSHRENKRKTIIFDTDMPECNMSMTNVIPNNNEIKKQILNVDSEIRECNMSMRSNIPCSQENKRKTIIFDTDLPECNMSMTSVIPNNKEIERRTLNKDSEMPECNISMTSIIPSSQENKRKTLIFNAGMPECNMSMTHVIPSHHENKRNTLIFDPGMPERDMSMTSVIPNNNEVKRQAVTADSEMPECNMSMTGVIPSSQENRRKTLILDPRMPECNMSMTGVISSHQKNKKNTLIIDPGMPKCNISMTSAIPNKNEINRHTLTVDSGMPEFNMLITDVIPSSQENKRKTSIFDPGMPECNMSMTHVIPSHHENKRNTLIFDPEMLEFNMSAMSVIPNNNEIKRQTLTADSEMPGCNMSMTGIISSSQENIRKTLNIDPGMPGCNMSMTSVIPANSENKSQTLIVESGKPESNISMTSVIPSQQEDKRKTIVFDPGMPECNMSMTSVIPTNSENKSQTLIVESDKPESNISMTSVIPSQQEDKRKTIVFDPGMPECNMSITSVIPANSENKRQTIIFDSEKTERDMSVTSVIPHDKENKRKTIIFDPGMPECNMSMTRLIPKFDENQVASDKENFNFNSSMAGAIFCKDGAPVTPECDAISSVPDDKDKPASVMLSSKVIQSCEKNQRNTMMDIEYNTPDSVSNDRVSVMLSTSAKLSTSVKLPATISIHQENQRKAIDTECNTTNLVPDDKETSVPVMLLTDVFPIQEENHRNTPIVDTECDVVRLVLDNKENNKAKPIILSTNVIPGHRENQRKTELSKCVVVTKEISSCSEKEKKLENESKVNNMPVTNITNLHDDKRNTITPECHDVFQNYENVKNLRVFDSEVMDEKDDERKTMLSNKDMPVYNMSTINEIQSKDYGEIKKSICVIENHNGIVEKDENMSMRNYTCQDNIERMEIPDTSRVEKEISPHEICQTDQPLPDVIERDVSILKMRNENNSYSPDSLNISQTNKMSLNLNKENIDRSCVGAHNISIQNKSIINKFTTVDEPENVDYNNKSIAYGKSADYSMSMTNVMPRSTHWESKNNITSTSFAVYNPVNETRSVLFEHFDMNKKEMINSSKSYGAYREVSCAKDISLTDSPDSRSMGDLSLPSIDDYKVASRVLGMGVEKCSREASIAINVPLDDSHMSVDDVDITLPSVDKSIKVDKRSLFETGHLEGTKEKNTDLSDDISIKPCDNNSFGEDAVLSPAQLVNSSDNHCPLNNIHEIYAESDYCERVNLPTAKNNLSLHSDQSGDLIKTLNQDLPSEAETLNKSDPISKSSNANKQQSDSSIQKVSDSGSSEMKMLSVPADLSETIGKRKFDHELNENFNFTFSKKQKVSQPVCTWLDDLDGDAESKANVTTQTVKCSQTQSGKHEIDTLTYTITKIDHEKDRILPTIEVAEDRVLRSMTENTEEADKNVQNNSDHLIANISDMSLVNSSFDKSDQGLRELDAAPVVSHDTEEKRKLCELIKSVDEIIAKQCGPSDIGRETTSNSRPRNSDKHENYRLTDVSLCESMNTSVELTESPVRLPQRRLTTQPENTSSPVKYVVEELIKDFDFKTKLCALEYIECNECVFLLMDGAIKMTVLLEPSPPGVSNLMHPVADITLALTNAESAKFSKSHQKFHRLAIKMALQELEVGMLRVMCLVSADLPKLLTHCSQVISQAWSWSRHYYILYIKYNLQFQNDRWTFEICSGNLLCIWEVEIRVRGGLLPYTKPDNVKVSTTSGDSPIEISEFNSVVRKIKPSWHYVPKLVEEIHTLVKNHCKTLCR